MTKTCPRCQVERDESEFYRFKDRWTKRSYLSSRCRPCHQEYKRESATVSVARKKEKLKLRYGITYEQWESMREKENHACMICGITEPEMSRHLDVDHCHASGVVRGLLCNPCNLSLANARDNVAILEAAIQYLKDQGGGYK